MSSSSAKSRGISGTKEHSLPYSLLQVKKVWGGGTYWYLQWQDIPTAAAMSPWESNVESLNGMIGNRSGFNGCTHTVISPFSVSISPKGCKNTPTLEQCSGSWRTAGLSYGVMNTKHCAQSHYSTHALPSGTFANVDWSALCQSAGESLAGHMRASSNMLVACAELGQTYKMLRHPMSFLSSIWGRNGNTLRQLAKAGSRGYLTYQFGWRQFCSDLKSLTQAWQKGRQYADALRRTIGRWSPIHSRVADEQSCTVQNPTLGAPSTTGIGFTLSDVSVRRTACFTLQVLREEAFQVLSSDRYASQYLGTDKMLEAVWDLVPWSFVIDWFVDVGRIVALNPYFLANRNQIRNMGYSLKTVHSAALTAAVKYSGLNYGATTYNEVFPVGYQEVQRQYQRVGGYPPSTLDHSLFGSFSSRNIATSGALIGQRW